MVSAPVPPLVRPPVPLIAPPSVVLFDTVRTRVVPPRLTVPLRASAPVPVPSPNCTLPPIVMLLALVRPVLLEEANTPPLIVSALVPSAALSPRRRVPAPSTVAPL